MTHGTGGSTRPARRNEVTVNGVTFRFTRKNQCRYYMTNAGILSPWDYSQPDPSTGHPPRRIPRDELEQKVSYQNARIHETCTGWWAGYRQGHEFLQTQLINVCSCKVCKHPAFDVDTWVEGEGRARALRYHGHQDRQDAHRAHRDLNAQLIDAARAMRDAFPAGGEAMEEAYITLHDVLTRYDYNLLRLSAADKESL